jgi:Fe-S cluster biogenesis protein NfuA
MDQRAAVEAALEQEVRPVLSVHGGDVDLIEVTPHGVVRLRFQKACKGCGYKAITLAASVRQRLLAIPGVTDVQAEDVAIAPGALRRIDALLGPRRPAAGPPEAATGQGRFPAAR